MNRDHVEPAGMLPGASRLQIGGGGADNLPALEGSHRLLGRAEGPGGPGLDLHKNQLLTLAGDQIDLPAAESEAPGHDLHPGATQEMLCGPLALRSRDATRILGLPERQSRRSRTPRHRDPIPHPGGAASEAWLPEAWVAGVVRRRFSSASAFGSWARRPSAAP